MSRSNPKNSKFSPCQKCECWFVVGSPERKVDTHATLVCIKVIRRDRKRWHWNPLFGHLTDEILKSMKKRITMDFNGA
jgi:hypothetical protein